MKSGNPYMCRSLAPLEEMSLCHLSFLKSKASSPLEVKMGRGGQDELAGKSEITLVTRAKNWDLHVFSTGDRELVFCFVLFLFDIHYFCTTMKNKQHKKTGHDKNKKCLKFDIQWLCPKPFK